MLQGSVKVRKQVRVDNKYNHCEDEYNKLFFDILPCSVEKSKTQTIRRNLGVKMKTRCGNGEISQTSSLILSA